MAKQNVLLDTHSWLWLLTEPSKFSTRTLKALSNPDTKLFLSVASIWEIAIKHNLGKLKLPEQPNTYVPAKLSELGIEELMIAGPHALAAGQLPAHHFDPFDRLIIAQSQIEEIPVLTADKVFLKYGIKLFPM